MAQEMLAGVGGVRAVRAYCRLTGTPAPEVFHTNEGHAGFLGLERMRELAAPGAQLRRGAGRRARRHRVHHPHPGPGRHRPVRQGPRPVATTTQPEWAALPVERVLELGAETDHGRVQHGPHGPAAGPARQRREQAARRGQPGDVPAAVAGLRRRGGADHLGHQRRARADLDVAASCWRSSTRERLGRAAAGGRRLAGPGQGRRTRSCGRCAGRCASGWSTRSAAGCTPPSCSAASPTPSWTGPAASSTRTCSPSASPAGCRRTSG